MTVNGRGTFLCYKYAGIQMVEQGRGGRIIGASSIAGKQGSCDFIETARHHVLTRHYFRECGFERLLCLEIRCPWLDTSCWYV